MTPQEERYHISGLLYGLRDAEKRANERRNWQERDAIHKSRIELMATYVLLGESPEQE